MGVVAPPSLFYYNTDPMCHNIGMMNDNCNQKIETTYIADVAIDNLASLPDYILAERDVVDVTTGNVARTFVRVPAQKLFPQGNYANVAAIQANNTAIDIPENEVRAGYVANERFNVSVQYANAAHAPMFLMLGFSTDLLLIQNTGIVNIPEGHEYVIGSQYYAAADGSGEPVTDAASGQKLFIPISKTQLAINLGA